MAWNQDVVPPPLPGNPGLIADFANRYIRMADALEQAVVELQLLANENVSISLAVDEVRARAEESVDATRRVSVRYDGAGNALNSYQRALADAQAKANAARSTISGNNPRAAHWRGEEDRITRDIVFGGSTPELALDLVEATRWVRHYDDEAAEAMAKYRAAESDRDAAVNLAIAALNDAAEAAGLNDNFFEAIEGAVDAFYDLAQKYLAPVIAILRDALEIIKSIVDILAFILTIAAIFIPVLGPIALALTLVSLVLGALVLICSIVLVALGKETMGRVIGDAINLAAGIITAKMGGAFKPGAFIPAGGTMGSRAMDFAVDYATQTPVTVFAGELAGGVEQGAFGCPPIGGSGASNEQLSGIDIGQIALSAGTGGISTLFTGEFAESWSDYTGKIETVVTTVTAVPAG